MKSFLTEKEQVDQYAAILRIEQKINTINEKGCNWAERKINGVYRFVGLVAIALVGAIATAYFSK